MRFHLNGVFQVTINLREESEKKKKTTTTVRKSKLGKEETEDEA